MSEMDIRPITTLYAVSPQIAASDMEDIASAGFKTVICNRPDSENPGDLYMAELARAATDAGLRFVENDFGAQGLGLDTISRQRDAIEGSSGPVLAYCRSGTRSATIWAFAMAGSMSADEILAAVAQAGYPMEPLRAQVDALANND